MVSGEREAVRDVGGSPVTHVEEIRAAIDDLVQHIADTLAREYVEQLSEGSAARGSRDALVDGPSY
jgi:hypothetical protein